MSAGRPYAKRSASCGTRVCSCSSAEESVRGWQVAPLSRSVLAELYRATGALEGLAARNIAAQPAKDRRDLATEMTKVDRAFRAAASARKPDWDELFDLHDSFHRRMREASDSPAVLSLLDALRPQVDRYEWFFAPLTGPDFFAHVRRARRNSPRNPEWNRHRDRTRRTGELVQRRRSIGRGHRRPGSGWSESAASGTGR